MRQFCLIILCVGLLTACARTVDEDDVFLPWMAEGTWFTIEKDGQVLFERNRVQDGLFDEMGLTLATGTVPTRIGNLSYRHVLHQNANRPLLVYCGGNSYDIPSHGDLVTWKAGRHGDLLLWDYPGYGGSEGEATVEDFQAAVVDLAGQVAQFRRDENQPILFWGHSLGGFICSELAGLSMVGDGVIYEATAPSSEAAISAAVPWYARLFVRAQLAPELIDFKSATALPDGPLKVLVLGARKDQILPIKLSRMLRDELSELGHKVTYHEFRKADHFTIGFDDDLDLVVAEFLQSEGFATE